MIKRYVLQYETEKGAPSLLHVADPDIKLENGNIEIITTFIGESADELIKELIKEEVI